MISETRTETVSLAEIPPPCFLTSGFIQCQYTPLMTYVSLLMFSLIEIRKQSYLEDDEEDYLLVVLWSRFVLRSWIHLSSHYCGVLHDFPSSLRPFHLLLFLRCEVPHSRSRGPILTIGDLFLISKVQCHHLSPIQELDQHQPSLVWNQVLRDFGSSIHQ